MGCGFTPLHLKTFLAAHLLGRLQGRSVSVETGLFGDLPGTLEGARNAEVDAVAVVIEWADLDPRLGCRSPAGWRSAQIADVLKTVSLRLDQLSAILDRLGERTSTTVALPALPLPPIFTSPTGTGTAAAFSLHERLQGFAAACAAKPRVRLLNPQKIDKLSPPGKRLDVSSELRSGFPYRCEHASVLGEMLAESIRPPQPKKGIITDLDQTLWRGILGEDGVDGISWDLDHNSLAHALYQGMLASLADIGVLLGAATKNDPELVAQALRRKT